MTLARDGWKEMLLISLLAGGATVALAYYFWPAAIVTALLWLAGLAFFRVPSRRIPTDPDVLIAPADGTVTDITPLAHVAEIGGPATRIGIFLSVFDVHVNRSPCASRVVSARHQPGLFLDARDARAGEQNESTTIVLNPDAPLPGPIVVRQIAGLIARRIVCRLSPGQRLARGELFGLIKFGSRTELIVPADERLAPAVAVGQRVAGGATILMRLTVPADHRKGSHEAQRPTREPAASA